MKNKRPLWSAACIFAAGLFLWLTAVGSPGEASSGEARPGEGERLTVVGRVYRAEERRTAGGSQLWIYLNSVVFSEEDTDETVEPSYCVICQLQDMQRPRLGSEVWVTGQFSYFSHADNPGEFDSARYYRTIGIGAVLRNGTVVKQGTSYSVCKELFFRLKEHWGNRLAALFPEKEASILTAMLLGDKTSLDSDIKELYQRNGIVHILSISGLHISLIGMAFYRLLRRLGCPVRISAVLGSLLLLGYGVMTGMGVSASRAIGMYLIRMLAEMAGRTYDMLTSLGIMAVILLAGQPEYLYNSGFLLSFGSICGIGLLLPALEGVDRGSESPADRTVTGRLSKAAALRGRLRKAMCPGLAVTLFTLPVQLMNYYQIPVYAVFLNLLVLPFAGVLLAAGMAVMLVPGLGVLKWIDIGILWGYEQLCRAFECLPGHIWHTGCPEVWQAAVYYLALGVFLYMKSRRRAGLCSGILLAAAVLMLGSRFDRGMYVTFLSVGQGDCIFLQTAAGEHYLFDCGSSSEKSVGEYTLIPYLQHQGVADLDAVFVSHPDSDHCSGILELLEKGAEDIAVKRLILPGIGEEMRGTQLGELLAAAEVYCRENQLQVAYMDAGDEWESGSTRFTCLHPEPGSTLTEANAYSQCFLVEDGKFSMLLTGDVEGEGEEELCRELAARGIGPVTVLKVAHHGSDGSTSESFLSLVQPGVAVISYGEGNSYGHPHPKLLERLGETGCAIYRTAVLGAVRMDARDKTVKITTFLDGERESLP